MQPETAKLLWELVDTTAFVMADTDGVSLDDYLADRRLRQSVERSFEIIGEVLIRLGRIDALVSSRITDYPKIIGLRNRLAHGYNVDIDHAIVWESVRESIPSLHAEVVALLKEAGEPS
jgi:uncharacterized protein with HEPN domain